jgi:hypothetical protein
MSKRTRKAVFRIVAVSIPNTMAAVSHRVERPTDRDVYHRHRIERQRCAYVREIERDRDTELALMIEHEVAEVPCYRLDKTCRCHSADVVLRVSEAKCCQQ